MECPMPTAYDDDLIQSSTLCASRLSFAVAVVLSELAFLQSRAALGFVFIFLTVIAATLSIMSGSTIIGLLCLAIILGMAGFGIAEFIRASNKLREMSKFTEDLKFGVEKQVGRAFTTGDRVKSDIESDPVRELLHMAEASRFSYTRR
jgi:hypothetical protein